MRLRVHAAYCCIRPYTRLRRWGTLGDSRCSEVKVNLYGGSRGSSVARLASGLLWVLLAVPGLAQERVAAQYSETEVKAAYLFHFASYVEWPAPGDSVTFAILGDPAVAGALERFAAGRQIQHRPVQVRQIQRIDELDGAEVLFIGAASNRTLRQLVAAVNSPTLIISDAQDGLRRGAMINFQLVDRRVRFEVALNRAQQAGLTLSSRLLSAALRVEMTYCHFECIERQYRRPLPKDRLAARLPGPDSLQAASHRVRRSRRG